MEDAESGGNSFIRRSLRRSSETDGMSSWTFYAGHTLTMEVTPLETRYLPGTLLNRGVDQLVQPSSCHPNSHFTGRD